MTIFATLEDWFTALDHHDDQRIWTGIAAAIFAHKYNDLSADFAAGVNFALDGIAAFGIPEDLEELYTTDAPPPEFEEGSMGAFLKDAGLGGHDEIFS